MQQILGIRICKGKLVEPKIGTVIANTTKTRPQGMRTRWQYNARSLSSHAQRSWCAQSLLSKALARTRVSLKNADTHRLGQTPEARWQKLPLCALSDQRRPAFAIEWLHGCVQLLSTSIRRRLIKAGHSQTESFALFSESALSERD